MPRTLFHRASLVALLAFVATAVSGCEQERQGSLDVTVIGDTLNVADASLGPLTEPQAVLVGSVAQGLVRFDARGQIVPGLAERWNVSDDGLSYIFRLGTLEWPDGGRVTAHQVARALRRQTASRSDNPIKDTLGAVDEIVAMTDRVIEIRLRAPRPNLLQILAQPDMAVLRDGRGTGPFIVAGEDNADEDGDAESAEEQASDAPVRLHRDIAMVDEEEQRREQVTVRAAEARTAIARFLAGNTDLVIGGTFDDLPFARAARLPRDSLRFDPAAGLFGLVPLRESGALGEADLRRALSQAIDRQALIAALDVPGLLPRATLLEPGLDGTGEPVAPDWLALPIADRRTALAPIFANLLADRDEPLALSLDLPEGPGGEIILRRLAQDWGAFGIRVERASSRASADLALVDMVAPSTSPAWFLRMFRCGEAAICLEDADALLDSARATPVEPQRAALLAEAARLMDEAHLFMPITAPIRWSLVSSQVQGFAGNRFARHPLTALGDKLNPERAE